MASDWRKSLSSNAKITYGIYFSSLTVAAAVYFLFPPSAAPMDAEWKMYFHEILVLAGVSVLFARWWGSQLFSKNALEFRYRVNGIEGAMSGLRIAALTGAVLGDFCVFLGAIFYVITRNPQTLWSMLAFWLLHLGMTIACLRQGKEEIESLVSKADAFKTAA